MALNKWNPNFRLEHSAWETGLLFQTSFCCSRELSTGTTWNVVFHNRTFLKLFANGKQPKFASLSNRGRVCLFSQNNRQVLRHYCLLCGHLLSYYIQKSNSFHFHPLFSINACRRFSVVLKLDRGFSHCYVFVEMRFTTFSSTSYHFLSHRPL